MASKEEQQETLLQALANQCDESTQFALSTDIARNLNWSHDVLVGVLKSIEMAGLIRTELMSCNMWTLTPEGRQAATEGSAEFRLLQALRNSDGVLPIAELKRTVWMNRGLSVCLQNSWVKTSDGNAVICPDAPEEDLTARELTKIGVDSSKGSDEVSLQGINLASFSKRQLASKRKVTYFKIFKTSEFALTVPKYVTDITKDMLISGSWKESRLKPYNFNAAGLIPKSGSTHPLINTLNMFRNILIQMGFSEMPTQRWVESSFWNFDALFQPQSHPVRDAHDTFFLAEPRFAEVPTQDHAVGDLTWDYFHRVKEMHECGDGDSLGWNVDWSIEESMKLIMRTHTTAVTTRMCYEMAQEWIRDGKPEFFQPRMLFSIDRVFRNETLDATHLAEFHQVEGIVAMQGASLAQLMGVIRSFFGKIGITTLKFKPAYNPYTEPSMEIFGFHPTLQRWTEVGNSGVFRPEMLNPMGLPKDVSVLGWGLSLERPTMISHNIKDIRELFGPKSKLSVF